MQGANTNSLTVISRTNTRWGIVPFSSTGGITGAMNSYVPFGQPVNGLIEAEYNLCNPSCATGKVVHEYWKYSSAYNAFRPAPAPTTPTR